MSEYFLTYIVMTFWFVLFFKQKTAYEMRISDWSSDVCSSDLPHRRDPHGLTDLPRRAQARTAAPAGAAVSLPSLALRQPWSMRTAIHWKSPWRNTSSVTTR